jgi:hypothetical protein
MPNFDTMSIEVAVAAQLAGDVPGRVLASTP